MIKQCNHYINRCTFFAKCCNEYYNCKRCHNDIIDHEFVCDDIKCDDCGILQPFSQKCRSCFVLFGEYCCDQCKLLDSTPDKTIFHCDKCGLCRLGIQTDFTHCDRCNCCIAAHIDEHICFDNRLKQNCPICLEYLDTSNSVASLLRCGHTLHNECMIISFQENNYKCPICSKAITVMTEFNEMMDNKIMMTPMPGEYRDKIVSIYCYECEKKCDTNFHILGLKCKNINCGSYNTTQI